MSAGRVRTGRRARSRVLGIGLAVGGLLAVTACAALTEPPQSAKNGAANLRTVAPGPLTAQLPADIRAAGSINIGSSIDVPPFVSYVGGYINLQGLEPALARELEEQLGVKLTWIRTSSSDRLFADLGAGTYDAVYSAALDTREREKSFDFIDYLKASSGVIVASGNPHGIKAEKDLCGLAIAAVKGSDEAAYLAGASAKCKSGAGRAITVMLVGSDADGTAAVLKGRAAALVEKYAVASWMADGSKQVDVVAGLQLDRGFYGMATRKDDTQLRDVLVKAWQAIIDNGSYAATLKTWKLTDQAVTHPQVNGGSATP